MCYSSQAPSERNNLPKWGLGGRMVTFYIDNLTPTEYLLPFQFIDYKFLYKINNLELTLN